MICIEVLAGWLDLGFRFGVLRVGPGCALCVGWGGYSLCGGCFDGLEGLC